jgi:hypothetical protein
VTAEERFWAKVDKSGDCWLWTGAVNHKGYGKFAVGAGKWMLAYRMAWQLAARELPKKPLSLDHICRVPACVRVDHLRVATRSQQDSNSGLRKDNTSGARGVSWDKRSKKWQVRVMHNGKNYFGGRFSDLNEAEAAAIALRDKLHGDRT